MDGNFKLNEPGFYTPVDIAANDFLNDKLTTHTYGIYYSVRFEGDAETYLWMAKSEPVKGEKVWGHIEESKSGKSLKFKKDKLEEGQVTDSGKVTTKPYQNNSKSITLGLVWKTVAGINGLPTDDAEFAKFYEIVNAHYSELILIQEKINDPA